MAAEKCRAVLHYCVVFFWSSGIRLYVVYIWKKSSTFALEGVSGVAAFNTIDEQLQKTKDAIFPMETMLPVGLPFPVSE